MNGGSIKTHHNHQQLHLHQQSNMIQPVNANNVAIPPDIDSPSRHLPLKTLQQRYNIISNLGNGSFGSVVLAKRNEPYQYNADKMSTLMNPIAGSTDLNSPLVAIKTMNKRLPKLKDYIKVKEVKFILAIPSHANLVFIHEMFVDNINYKLHIVMETMDQNLYQLMKARRGQLFSEGSVKSILSQILAGVRHIHKYNYFHRDLKPENILITINNGFSNNNIQQQQRLPFYTVKLADYGLARSVGNQKPYTAYVSTRWYRSPEILLRQKHYSRPIDIWAFGAVAAEIASFRPLFPGSNELDQTWKVLKVLGAPYKPPKGYNYHFQPLGGYWKDAQILSGKLGFQLSFTPGYSIEQIIDRPELALLGDAVKACLTWDPNLRIDVESLCKMPYFRGTIVNPYNENVNPPQEMMNKSELFAGLKPIDYNSMNNLKQKNSSNKHKSLLLKKSANSLSPISYNDHTKPFDYSQIIASKNNNITNSNNNLQSPHLRHQASDPNNNMSMNFTGGLPKQFPSPHQQTNTLSHCDSATDSLMSNNHFLKLRNEGIQNVPSARSSYLNYSSSIESESIVGFENDKIHQNNIFFDNSNENYSNPMGNEFLKQNYYYDFVQQQQQQQAQAQQHETSQFSNNFMQ